MKTRMTLVAISLMLIATFAIAQTDDPRCNNRLIRGDYGFTLEGQRLVAPNVFIPQVGVAMTKFDGNGNLTQTDTVVFGGAPAPVADFTHPLASGTYTVNSNCTGTFTIVFQDNRPPVSVNFVLSDNGNEIDTVVVSPSVLATRSIGKRIFHRDNE